MARLTVELESLGDQILWYLHSIIAKDENRNISAGTLARELNLSQQTIEILLENLIDQKYCTEYERKNTLIGPLLGRRRGNVSEIVSDKFVRISLPGIRYVESWGDEEYDRIQEVVTARTSERDSTNPDNVESELAAAEHIPASDRYVPLDHNSQEYQDAVSSVDELIDAIEKTNSFFEDNSEHRKAILSEIKAGRQLLEAHFAEPSLVKRLLYHPITWIAATVMAATINPVATRAGEAIAKLIGLG